MLQHSLLATKLYIPPVRPELVSRPRLVKRLDAGMRRKLTLVSAPAGFGKTTLLSEWIHGSSASTGRGALTAPLRVGWLSLDEGDNDLTRFLTYLVAAVQTIEGKVGQGLLASLQSPGTVNAEAILTTLLNEIADLPAASLGMEHGLASGRGLILVLDDYHVIESQSIDRALTFLLDHMPPAPGGLHLVIASRTDPTLPLSRLRARGQLTELRQGDLRFTTGEAAAFLQRVMRLRISSDDVRRLEDRTEGWITGLQLAAVAMQGLGQTNQVAGFIKGFSGSHRYVIDYLLDEVFHQQSPEVQEFLLRTSILDRMVASLCNAVCFGHAGTPDGCEATAFAGQRNSQEMLEQLETANLFLVPLDGERNWYRYHHLFADLLGQRLRQTQPEQVPILHGQACEWYERHGFQPEAVYHALAGSDSERAATLIEANALSFIGQGAFTTVRNWIDALPEGLVRNRPYLCVYHAWASNFTHELNAIEPCLQDAEHALQAKELPAHDPESRDVRGQIATLRAWNARRQRDNELAIELLQEAVDLLGDGNPFARTFADLNLGLAYLDDGELVEAAASLRDAVAQGGRSGNELASLMATSHLAAVLILQGRLHEAEKLCRWTLDQQLARHERPPPTLCMIYLRLGWVLAEWNDVDGFFAHVSQAVVLADQMGYDSMVRTGSWTMAWEQQLLAEQGKVIEFSEEVAGIIERVLAAETGAGGTTHSSDGDAGTSTIEDQNTDVYLEDDAYFEIWPGYSEHARARRLANEGKVEEALDLLARIYESARMVEGIGLMIEARSMEALICQAQGDLDRALYALGDALTLGEPEGYVRTFVDRGAPMAELLHEAAERGVMPGYVRRLLSAFGAGEPGDTAPPHQPLVEPLSRRELEVLQLIAEGLSNREIGERLFVALTTVKGHNRRIYGKLQVQRRTEAVARARELGLL